MVLTTAFIAAGCNGGSSAPVASPVEDANTEQTEQLLPDELSVNDIPGDSLVDDDSLDFSDPDPGNFDIAEYFFSEVDRQWFCSVTTPVSVFTDQLYVDRLGGGWFERFGLVQWTRHNEPDQLDIVTTVEDMFSLREIFGTNTILEFQRHVEDTEASELYDCVLTTRDAGLQ